MSLSRRMLLQESARVLISMNSSVTPPWFSIAIIEKYSKISTDIKWRLYIYQALSQVVAHDHVDQGLPEENNGRVKYRPIQSHLKLY